MSDDGGYREWQMQKTLDALQNVAEELLAENRRLTSWIEAKDERIAELETQLESFFQLSLDYLNLTGGVEKSDR